MLLYLSIFGFFVAALLFLNSRKKFTGNYYLVGFYMINSLNSLAIYSTFFGDSAHLVAVVQINFMSVFYLAGPFMYFYVRSLVNDNPRLYKSDLWHFLPFIILTIGIIPYVFKPFAYKLDIAERLLKDGRVLFDHYNVIVPQEVNIIFRWIYYLGYFLFAGWYYWKYRTEKIHRVITSGNHKRRLDAWILVLLTTSILITSVLLWLTIDSYFSPQFHANVKDAAVLLYTMAIAYIVLNFSLFVFPEFLYGYPHSNSLKLDQALQQFTEIPERSAKREDENDAFLPESLDVEDLQTSGIDPYSTAKLKLLTNEYLRLIEKRMLVVVEQKVYLKPEFSIVSLSDYTNIPIHHLSYYLNHVLHKKFNVWRNKLRIEHALLLINQGLSESMTLAAISEACGYTSQATFITAFKQVTGTTPSHYIKAKN